MKKFSIVILVSILLASCQQGEPSSDDTSKIADKDMVSSFEWLLGKWKRISVDTTFETYENWTRVSNKEYTGHGFVLNNSDTVWQERMTLSSDSSNWSLMVKTADNTDQVKFELSEIKNNSFTAENPSHDFPKRIKYWKAKERLMAQIEGDTAKVSFEFKKLN